MQTLLRSKAYKSCEPLSTINRIRKILSDCGLFTIETHVFHDGPNINCCRVMLGDDDLYSLGLGTNGKGMTRRYALASAYGEFMERLQNNVMFPLKQLKFATRRYLESTSGMEGFYDRLRSEDLVLEFHYAADEVYLDADEVAKLCTDVLCRVNGIDTVEQQREYLNSIFKDKAIACVPYYSVFNDEIRILPGELIWNTGGTNGMCAGNTPKEALIQGISEIFERFAIRTIYLKNITPPTIPFEYFEGTEVYMRLIRLKERTGMDVIVKDCSLGMELPVIGLMLIDRGSSTYTFHVGADPSPITALERCLTEIYQGDIATLKARFHPLPSGKKEISDQRKSEIKMHDDFYSTTLCGAGEWPSEVVSEDFSYQFNGFGHPVSSSDDADIDYLINIVSQLGYQLFIRDVSYLGFPAYHVFIPGMSEVDFIFDKKELKDWMGIARQHRALLNLPGAAFEELEELVAAIDATSELPLPVSFEPKNWFVSNAHSKLLQYPKHLLMANLFFRISDYRKAAWYIKAFLNSEQSAKWPVLYYRGVYDFLEAMAEGKNITKIEEALILQYGELLTEKVIKNFSNPEKAFEGIDLPRCFDCASCSIQKNCKFFVVLRCIKNLQNAQIEHLPDQRRVAELFCR